MNLVPRTFQHGWPITLHSRVEKRGPDGKPEYDEYGNVQYVDIARNLAGIVIWPESSTEVGQGNERTNVVYHAMLTMDIDVDAVDYVTWRGKDYEIQGEPQFYRSPMSNTQHQTIRIARVEG